ncbi:hypothetical protein GCM10027594_27910 [Hymenobacter agri]
MLTKFYPWFLLLILLQRPHAVQAQAYFRSGYVVALTGDTLRGTVDYGRGKHAAAECRFKPAATAATVTYLPNQLRGYGFSSDRFYQSQRVPATAADTTSKRVFLEVLVLGAASLYYATDGSGDHYYIRMGNGPVQPLEQLFKEVNVNGSRVKREVPLYRSTLGTAFDACPTVRNKVVNLSFSRSGFIQLCQEYNACVGGRQTVSEVASSKKRSYFVLEAVAGAQASVLRFDGAVPMHDIDIKGGVQPVFGLALQQYVPVLSNRFGVRLELLYQRQRYNQEIYVPTTYAYQAYEEVRVSLDQVRLPLLLKYQPLNGRFRPFVEVGASFGFALNNSNEYRYRAQPSATYSAWMPILESPRSIEEGILGGVGAALQLPNNRHLALELRVERTNGFSPAPATGTGINRAYLLFSYDLSKPRSSN